MASLVGMALMLAIHFPGAQLGLALTLASGIGIPSLQARVDKLEEQAIAERPFTGEDRQFLRDLYATLAKGAHLALVVRQSAEMMDRYLAATGEPLHTAPRIFLGSRPVRRWMEKLRAQALRSLSVQLGHSVAVSSPTFYMGDPEFFDAFVGLYYGHIELHAEKRLHGPKVLRWRAEVPWQWPTYAQILEHHGDPHAQSFPLPNALSLLLGEEQELYIDDGLGAHLERLGLASAFLVYAEWEEIQ